MGRNKKIGLDYFPFDVDFFSDIKVRKLIKYQGGKAVTVYALLLCNIYKQGYYMRWDKELPFIISEQTGFEEVYIQEVIKCCMLVGLFSKDLFEQEKILTSKGIQERYKKICDDCRRVCEFLEYNLVSSVEKVISSEEKRVTSEENGITSAKSTQIKGNKSKENNNTPIPPEGGSGECENENLSKNDSETNLPKNPPEGEKEKKSCGKRKEKGNGFPAFAQRFVDSIPDPEWRDLFTCWLKYKKDRGNSYKSEDSLKMALEKLKKMSGSDISVATEIVENSIANNWQGLFPLKNIYNNGINRNSEIYEVYAPVSDFSGTKSTL